MKNIKTVEIKYVIEDHFGRSWDLWAPASLVPAGPIVLDNNGTDHIRLRRSRLAASKVFLDIAIDGNGLTADGSSRLFHCWDLPEFGRVIISTINRQNHE